MANPKDKKDKLAASILSLNKKKEIIKKEEQSVVQETTIKKKVGRPSTKKTGINYVKIGGLVRNETKKRMKIALLTTFENVHDSQEEFLDAAINFYIENYK